MSKQIKPKQATDGLSKRDTNLFNQMVVSARKLTKLAELLRPEAVQASDAKL
jgi:hypothetical protein